MPTDMATRLLTLATELRTLADELHRDVSVRDVLPYVLIDAARAAESRAYRLRVGTCEPQRPLPLNNPETSD